MKLTIEQYLTALRADARRWAPTTPEIIRVEPPRRWTRRDTLRALAMGAAK